METTITLSTGTVSNLLPADPSCSTCNGTGYDPDFKCTCTCRIETLRGRSRWINAVGVQGDVARHTHGNGTGSGRSSHSTTGATEKQQAFYGKLLTEAIAAAGNDDRAMGSVNGVNERWNEARTVSAASAVIDAMLSLIKQIKAAGATSAPAAPAQIAARANKYDARCESCHGNVPAGTGSLERVGGKWIVKHVGSCPEGEHTHEHEADGLHEEGTLRYALREDDGTVKFYKVDKPSKGKWAGWTFLAAQASDDYFPIKDKATKAAVLARIAEDPEAAMVLYGQEIGRCGHCNRTLTSEWRERGIGPVCATKMGF